MLFRRYEAILVLMLIFVTSCRYYDILSEKPNKINLIRIINKNSDKIIINSIFVHDAESLVFHSRLQSDFNNIYLKLQQICQELNAPGNKIIMGSKTINVIGIATIVPLNYLIEDHILNTLKTNKMIYFTSSVFINSNVTKEYLISEEEIKNFFTKYEKVPYLIYIDDNYVYEIWKIMPDNELKLKKRIALNPDVIIHDYEFEYPGILPLFIISGDVHNTNLFVKPNGFIWMKLGDKDAVVAGEQNRMTIPMEVNEGYLTAPTGWLIGNLDGTYSMDKNTGVATVYRKHGTLKYIERDEVSGKEQEVTINLKAGDKKITVNGKSEELPIAVYEKDGSLMVPLRKICEYLGAEYHFRHADNTVLIARFPKSEN